MGIFFQNIFNREGASGEGQIDYLLWAGGNIKYILPLPYWLVKSILTIIFHFIGVSRTSFWISVILFYNTMTSGNMTLIGLFSFISNNFKLCILKFDCLYNFHIPLCSPFSSLWGNACTSCLSPLFTAFSQKNCFCRGHVASVKFSKAPFCEWLLLFYPWHSRPTLLYCWGHWIAKPPSPHNSTLSLVISCFSKFCLRNSNQSGADPHFPLSLLRILQEEPALVKHGFCPPLVWQLHPRILQECLFHCVKLVNLIFSVCWLVPHGLWYVRLQHQSLANSSFSLTSLLNIT